MHSLSSLVVVGLLASLVPAAPAPAPEPASAPIQKRTFKVDRVRNEQFKGRNGPRELLKAYAKYSMPIPPALMDSIMAQQTKKPQGVSIASVGSKAAGNGTAGGKGTGLVTATPEPNDVEYLSPVNIGGQTLNLDFDTGSSDLWVFSTSLPQNIQQGHTNFDPARSTSFKMMQGSSFTIRYGDGSGAAGLVGTETVDIGGVTVTEQAVEMATTVSGSFIRDQNNNGLVGLAFSKLNTVKPTKQKTFFDNVMPTLAEPLFTADLRKGVAGAYEFGRIDNTKFTGQMQWAAINTTRGFWQFSSQMFAVGTGAPQMGTPGGQAIADTGTTLMLANAATVNGYYSQVPGAENNQQVGGITVPCDSNPPDLMIDVDGKMAKVKGSDIVFAQVQGNTCFGGMQPTTSTLQIYGDIFFKSQFVVFNGGNNSLGFADHV